MTRILAALLLAALSFAASAEVWQARYGVAETFDFKLYNADGTLDVDEADGGTEVSVSCNEGAETTATNDFVDEGAFYSIALTATEMQCERVTVVVAATTTEVFFIQTSANASAMTPAYDANVTQFGGTAGTFASGRPEVNTTHAAGTAWNSGAIGATTLATDTITAAKAAADLTTELQSGLATASSLTTVGTNVSTLLEALVVLGAEQTADSGTTTTIVDAALTQGTDGWFNGMAVHFTSGTLLGQASCATGFTASSDTLTFSPAVTTAVTTHTYYLLPDAECATGDPFGRIGAPAGASVSADIVTIDNFVDDLESRLGTPSNLGGGATVAANLSDIEAQTDDIGAAGAGLTNIDLPNQTMDITGTITTATSVTNMVTANATQISGDSAVADRFEAMLDGTCGSYPELGVVRGIGCTAQAYTAGTPSVTLDAAAAFGDNTLTGATLLICGSTQGYCQSATAASNVGSTDVVTLTAALPVAATGTVTVTIFGTATGGGDVNVTTIEGTDATTVLGTAQTGDAYARLGAPAGASVSADIAAVKSDSAAILVDTGTTLDDLVDDLESRLGTPSNLGGGATLAANAADIEGQTDDIGTAGAGLTNIDLPNQTMNITGTLSGSVGSVTGAVGSVTGNVGGNVTGSVGSVINLEQVALADAAVINCVTNTANFAGSATTVACILTDRDTGAITAASGDLEGRELLILSGAQIYEGRFINDTTWDGANSELRLTLSRALPGTLADAVTAIIR